MPAKYGVLGVRRQERPRQIRGNWYENPSSCRAVVPIPVDVLAAEAKCFAQAVMPSWTFILPDTECPDRFLGTCPECGAWFLIDDQVHLMIPVPDLRLYRHN